MRHRATHGVAALLVMAAGVVAPSVVGAQAVLLEIRPRPGDTLHLRLEQLVEMTGVTRVGGRDSTMTMTMSTAILARAIIMSGDTLGSRVLAVTDSVAVSGTGTTNSDSQERSGRAMQGSRVEMRVFPDGSSEIVSDPAVLTSELRSLVAQMPATLPRRPIEVGYVWTREVTVPVEARGGFVAAASLRTTFTFDSLSRDKEIAYISMRGELSRSAADSAAGRPGVEMTGTLRGGMSVDRHRGWMTASHAVINLRSVLPALPGTRAQPVRFNLTIRQQMRALDKR